MCSRLLKNAHLRRYPHSASLRRTCLYASLFEICPQKTRTPHPSGESPVSGALHLDVFEQPDHQVFFSNLVEKEGSPCRVKERHLEKEGATRMVRGAMENVVEKVIALAP
jgi:hypothetical protein